MVKIVQLLCPQRHAILAAAYQEGKGSFLECCDGIEELVGPQGPFKRKCMLCGSIDLHFEEGQTPYQTMKEAAPHLRAMQEANIKSRMILDAQGKTLEKFQ